MRRLRLRGRWIPRDKHVEVMVMDRECNDEKFCDDGREDDYYFLGSGCCLIASTTPWNRVSTPPVLNSTDGLLDVGIGGLGALFYTSKDRWELIKKGVAEYNSWIESKEVTRNG